MRLRSKILLILLAILLAIAGLLWYQLPRMTALVLEQQLKAAGLGEVELDIISIGTRESRIRRLQTRHATFELLARDVVVRYTPTLIKQASIESIAIDSLHVKLNRTQSGKNPTSFPLIADNWIAALPLDRLTIRQGHIVSTKPVQGFTHFDFQAQADREADRLIVEALLLSKDKPSLAIQITANADKTFKLALKQENTAATALTVNGRDWSVQPDRLESQLIIDTELALLQPILSAWLSQYDTSKLIGKIHSTGSVAYDASSTQLQTHMDLQLQVGGQSLIGPVAARYQSGELSVALKQGLKINMGRLQFAEADIPRSVLAMLNDMNCQLRLETLDWQCGPGDVRLSMPELRYHTYKFNSGSAVVNLQQLQGARKDWQAKADVMLPDVKLHLPDNSVRIDQVQAQLSGTAKRLQANVILHAANDKMVMDVAAQHDLQRQRGQADIKLRPVALTAANNIPGKLLRRWPYPLHLVGGELSGQSSFTWQKKQEHWGLQQQATLTLHDLQGEFNQFPFSGLSGKLRLSGIDSIKLKMLDKLVLASVNPGLPITDLSLRADAMLIPGQPGLFNIQAFRASMLGGQIKVEDAVLDLRRPENRINVDVRDLDLSRLVRLEQKKGLRGTGKLSGQLPILIDQEGVSMAAGELHATPPYGVIQYIADERILTLAKSNPNISLLVRALSDFRYDLLEAKLDYDPKGQLLAKVSLQGRNPELEGGRPIHLNINLEENIPALIQSLQYANEISRQVGEGIQKGAGQR